MIRVIRNYESSMKNNHMYQQKPCKYRVCRLVGPAWVRRFPVSWACLGHLGSPWGLLGAIFGTFLGHLHPELYPQRCSSERNFIVEDIVPDLFSLLRPLKNHLFFKGFGKLDPLGLLFGHDLGPLGSLGDAL